MSSSGPSIFSPSGPQMPGASLSGPPLPQLSSPAPGGLSTMPPSSLPARPMPPGPQPRGHVPMFPGAPHNQAHPPPTGSLYQPMGLGYPPGGPGTPATKSFSAPSVPPPPTGTEIQISRVISVPHNHAHTINHISLCAGQKDGDDVHAPRSEEHTSELQSR